MKITDRDRFIRFAMAGYVTIALAWIFLSDQLLSLFADIESIVWLSTAKGIFFVIASAGLFYLALRVIPPSGNRPPQHLLETLAAGNVTGQTPAWMGYLFAVTISLTMLLVRNNMPVAFDERPLLVMFMFPIILSALVGGSGPSLAATAVTALGVDYLMIPPVNSLRIASSNDLLQFAFLLVNGLTVSLLSAVLRKSAARVEINRRLLDTVISGTPDAVYVKDAHGRYLLANTAAAGFVGKSREEIIGKDDRSLFPAASAREVMETDQAIMATGRMQTREERVTTLVDGCELVFLTNKGPVFDASGQIVGIFGIAREISDRKRADDEIRRLNADLERRVTERTAELRAANLELEELAYALAHNLRAPLRAIGGFAQMLKAECLDKHNDEAKTHIEQIVRASANMGALIDGILALLRCTRGELQRAPVDVSALAAQRLDDLSKEEPQRRVNHHVEAGLMINGDAAMLGIMIRHLIDNAWKFTRDRKEGSIRVTSGVLDGHSAICIEDNGAGFDMAHAGRLFQPFQRLHRQDEFPGIGIGLATVQRIIQRHSGEIRVTATPGVGTTVCFCLPQSAPMEHGNEC